MACCPVSPASRHGERASYLSSLELRGLAIENIARLHALGEHSYRPIKHALDVRRNLNKQ